MALPLQLGYNAATAVSPFMIAEDLLNELLLSLFVCRLLVARSPLVPVIRSTANA
jgi:hypothetical protein